MLKKSWTLAVSVAMNISLQLCFVSVHGPRETYFVDEPRITALAKRWSWLIFRRRDEAISKPIVAALLVLLRMRVPGDHNGRRRGGTSWPPMLIHVPREHMPDARVRDDLLSAWSVLRNPRLLWVNARLYFWTELRGLSPRANYTDRATAACRRNANFCG
jgi:hypothetical protein